MKPILWPNGQVHQAWCLNTWCHNWWRSDLCQTTAQNWNSWIHTNIITHKQNSRNTPVYQKLFYGKTN